MLEVAPTSIHSSSQKGMRTHHPSMSRSRRDTPSLANINRFLAETNDNPKPFTWTADPDAIIEKSGAGNRC